MEWQLAVGLGRWGERYGEHGNCVEMQLNSLVFATLQLFVQSVGYLGLESDFSDEIMAGSNTTEIPTPPL